MDKEKKLEKSRIRDKLRYNKRKADPKRIEYIKNYKKNYCKRPKEIIKKRIRRMTQYYYGKVPRGYNRHHLDYDTPHSFILIPIKEHYKKHRKYKK